MLKMQIKKCWSIMSYFGQQMARFSNSNNQLMIDSNQKVFN